MINSITLQALLHHKNGGGRGIRTPAGFDTPVGFQDRSLQPDLGIPPFRQDLYYHILSNLVNNITDFFIKFLSKGF